MAPFSSRNSQANSDPCRWTRELQACDDLKTLVVYVVVYVVVDVVVLVYLHT